MYMFEKGLSKDEWIQIKLFIRNPNKIKHRYIETSKVNKVETIIVYWLDIKKNVM